MKKNDKIRPFRNKKDDLLDQLIKKKDLNEIGLLDLVLIEEMVNQKKREKTD